MAEHPAQTDFLELENDRLRQQNERLLAALEEVRAKLTEPEEIIRAIRHGEIDALVVEEKGFEEIYSLQTFDSVYRAVVEQCFPHGVWLARLDGTLLYVSSSYLQLLETDLRALQQKGQFSFLPPEAREQVQREWERCLATRKPFNVEYMVTLRDGSRRAIWTQGIIARTQDGQAHWVGVNIDVTERKRIKDELSQQARALQEADRRKDEFLALLGHELRNPLAAIHNCLRILLTPGVNPGDVDLIKQIMQKQVHHLTRMVDDLLDVNRITQGKIRLHKKQVELAAALRHAAEAAGPLIEAQRHDLTLAIPEAPLYLQADPTRLEQILVNLLNNAAKYTSPGGSIRLSAERLGNEAVIRVKDSGVGIPADVLPKIFNLFVQVDRSLDRTQGGLGIGLTLVKTLVELHGGTIAAHSEGPDRGSEFVIRLPLSTGEVPEPEQPFGGRDSRARRHRVLVVDDSRDTARTLKILLELAGHEVRVVHDGLATLPACRNFDPDVVLLDIGLPGMDGYEIARQLRSEQKSSRPLVVAISGYGQAEDKKRAREAGFDFHMTKPVDPEALGSLIASAPSLLTS
jgi:PAS domain S-box-containing protein